MPGSVASFPSNVDLVVDHIGYDGSQMQILLSESGHHTPSFVIELHGVSRFFDDGVVQVEPITVHKTDPGSFSWKMSQEQRAEHTELHLNLKEDPINNLFRALARAVVFREYEGINDLNYPG
jgi:hypothetical protein